MWVSTHRLPGGCLATSIGVIRVGSRMVALRVDLGLMLVRSQRASSLSSRARISRPSPRQRAGGTERRRTGEQRVRTRHVRVEPPQNRGSRCPGRDLNPYSALAEGGFSRPGAVRPVLWIPFAQLRCGPPVRRVRLASRVSGGVGESRAGSVQETAAFRKEHAGVPGPPATGRTRATTSHQVATLGHMKVATSTRIEVGVRDLKNNLSRYLDQVEAGVEIVVTDRGRPIARLNGMADQSNDKLAALIEAGLVRPPTSKVRQRPVPLRSSGSVSDLVAEQRQ